MKRSLIAVAVLLLLLSSTTYAYPPRAPRVRFFWGPVLAWFGFGHHHQPARIERPDHGHRSPAFVPRYRLNPGWHFGWERGRHYGWNHNNQPRGHRPGGGRPREGEREHGREGGRGRS